MHCTSSMAGLKDDVLSMQHRSTLLTVVDSDSALTAASANQIGLWCICVRSSS